MKFKRLLFPIIAGAALGVWPATLPAAEDIPTATAQRQIVTDWYEAVGTLRPRVETQIAAQIIAQVVEVNVRPGDRVEKGQALLTLDSRQAASRLDQARQGLRSARSAREQALQNVVAAEAAHQQARADYRRVQNFYEAEAATERELEKARSAFLQARAGLKRARDALEGAEAGIQQAQEVVREAEIAKGFSTLEAPEAGEVLRRMVEPGDLAAPGKPLLVLQTEGTLRLEAYVREGLIRRLSIGTELTAEINPLDARAPATVEEIVPYADPATRTFLVKAAIPPMEGAYPGMFGKLRIPVGETEVVTVPPSAVRKVGQLELVQVKTGDGWQRRYVKTRGSVGPPGAAIEVLSGLSGGETLALEEAR
ncbi:MAG: efflux RND transporter periplasmic adaptor subunit [Desulfococcaceae bacterium]